MNTTSPFMTKRTAANLLRIAAKNIEKYGMCKGSYEIGIKCCAIGAINTVVNLNATKHTVKSNALAGAVIKANNLGDGTRIIEQLAHGFNDVSTTTKNDVARAFRRTARFLEHGGSL